MTAAGEGSCLAVLAGAGVDAGLVAYEMAVLVKRVGEHLGVSPRPVAVVRRSGVTPVPPARPPVAGPGRRAGRPPVRADRRPDPAGRRAVRPARAGLRGARRRAGHLRARARAADVLRLCRLPTPVADLASDLDLPLGVVRILLSDLRERGLVTIHRPVPGPADRPAAPEGGRRWPTQALTRPG